MKRKGEGLGLIYLVGSNTKNFLGIFQSSKKKERKLLEKLEKTVREDAQKEKFNKVNYGEAYADNFARMYGYGAPLISALQKMSKDQDSKVNSWFSKESKRQQVIISIAIDMIKDCHKTDIHRAKALIEEYKKDINDPNTPPNVKKALQEDLKELQTLLDKYTNSFSDTQNKVNKIISETLDEFGEKEEPDKEESITESNYYQDLPKLYLENFLRANVNGQFREFGHPIFADQFQEAGILVHEYIGLHDENNADYQEWMTESKKAYEKMKEDIERVTPEENAEFKRRFPNAQCSLSKDKDGKYRVRTHRACSKDYDSIDKIPKKVVDFISSTS